MQLAIFADRWVKRITPDLAAGTLAHYGWALQHILPRFGHMTLRAITRPLVKEWLVELQASKLKPKSVKLVRSTLHSVFAEAIEDGIVGINPAAAGRRKRGRRALEHSKPKALDAGQFLTLVANAALVRSQNRRPRWSALIFATMGLTGLRPGEAMALKRTDFDWKRQTLRVQRTIDHGSLIVETTKTGRARDVDVPADLCAVLRAYCDALPDDWLWGTRDRFALRRAFRIAAAAAGLPPGHTPHHLRHTYASLQLQRGVSIYYVQRMLGHSDIRLTVHLYGSWLPPGDTRLANELESSLALRFDVTTESQPASERTHKRNIRPA